MTQLEKPQNRLNELPEDQREAMAVQVLDEWDALEWDVQIAADAKAGKPDDTSPAAAGRHGVQLGYEPSE
jgi:hypothetical protein